MDGIRSSSGGSGCLLTVRPAGEFRPGDWHPHGARGGPRRGRRGARVRGPGLGDQARPGPGSGSGWLGRRGGGEEGGEGAAVGGSDPRAEAPTRKLRSQVESF